MIQILNKPSDHTAGRQTCSLIERLLYSKGCKFRRPNLYQNMKWSIAAK